MKESGEPHVDGPRGAAEEIIRVRPGRKQDRTRDAVILDAALDVPAETNFAGMTLAAVAERAKAGKLTFYRRWPSKEHLGLEAVARMKQDQLHLEHLPETGALRTDIFGLFRPASVKDGERTLRVMTGLSAMLATHPGLAEAANDAIVEPWSAALRLLMHRAEERREIADTAAIDTLAQVIPEWRPTARSPNRNPLSWRSSTRWSTTSCCPRCPTRHPRKKTAAHEVSKTRLDRTACQPIVFGNDDVRILGNPGHDGSVAIIRAALDAHQLR